MLQSLQQINPAHLSNVISSETILHDRKIVPHLSNILAVIHKTSTPDVLHVSNIVKQTLPSISHQTIHPYPADFGVKTIQIQKHKQQQKKECIIRITDWDKLEWAGVSFNLESRWIIQNEMKKLADLHSASEIRFWGKILGIYHDYYVIQAIKTSTNPLFVPPPSSEPQNTGINFFTYFVTNSLHPAHWQQLPFISPHHIKVSRQIKRLFTGNLNAEVGGFPKFQGEERHYLKAQLVRMTSSLQIVPKGIFKLNDQNPKVTEYEEEVKIPEFAQLSALETWQHRNANVLSLGRTTHYIDPSMPQDQIEAYTAELAEKDPQIQRLRGITEDKLPQGNIYNVENLWSVRIAGDNQVFTKEDATLVYGVAVLKNLYWPGWITVGYKNGFSSIYVGYGQKSTQPVWNTYQNPNLMEDPQEKEEYPEPNPKQLPKPPEEPVNQEGQPPQDEE